jgi:hypothetical protein
MEGPLIVIPGSGVGRPDLRQMIVSCGCIVNRKSCGFRCFQIELALYPRLH